MADEVVVEWPDRYSRRVGADWVPRRGVRAHPRHQVRRARHRRALRTEVGYLGAMGSRRTHDDALEPAARSRSGADELIARVMGPIGLDIGARTPEETAVAICAEIIAAPHGIAAPSLRRGDGPIHQRVSVAQRRPAQRLRRWGGHASRRRPTSAE